MVSIPVKPYAWAFIACHLKNKYQLSLQIESIAHIYILL